MSSITSIPDEMILIVSGNDELNSKKLLNLSRVGLVKSVTEPACPGKPVLPYFPFKLLFFFPLAKFK